MVTLEIARTPIGRTDVTIRTAAEIRRDERDAAHRADVALKVTAVTLTCLVSVSLLLGYGLTIPGGSRATIAAAALVAIVFPFVAAVIATRNRRFVLGGVYVVLTLAVALTVMMVLPALSVARFGL
jgi:hypothetical protein